MQENGTRANGPQVNGVRANGAEVNGIRERGGFGSRSFLGANEPSSESTCRVIGYQGKDRRLDLTNTIKYLVIIC